MVEKESYYLTLILYIEANAHRAKLTKKAEDWKYASLHERVENNRKLLSEPYIELYDEWVCKSTFERGRVRKYTKFC
jgi:putative transposase